MSRKQKSLRRVCPEKKLGQLPTNQKELEYVSGTNQKLIPRRNP